MQSGIADRQGTQVVGVGDCSEQSFRANFEPWKLERKEHEAWLGSKYSKVTLAQHFTLRAEYRGFVYKDPDFGIGALNTDSWTHTAQPSAGIVYGL